MSAHEKVITCDYKGMKLAYMFVQLICSACVEVHHRLVYIIPNIIHSTFNIPDILQSRWTVHLESCKCTCSGVGTRESVGRECGKKSQLHNDVWVDISTAAVIPENQWYCVVSATTTSSQDFKPWLEVVGKCIYAVKGPSDGFNYLRNQQRRRK